jgi:hypothetical protein
MTFLNIETLKGKKGRKLAKRTTVGTVLALLFTSTFALVLGVPFAFGQGAKVGVSPPEVTTRLGREMTVNVTVTDVGEPGIYSYEFKLYYNQTLLTPTSASIPEDHFLKPSKPANIFIVDPGTINQDQGFVSFAVTLLGDEPGKTGSGTLGTIVLKSNARGNTTLEIRDLVLVDPSATPIPTTEYTVENGTVIIDGGGAGADINGDGVINIEDIALAAQAFGTSPGDPRWDPAADINKDGTADIRDLVAIAIAWNTETSA